MMNTSNTQATAAQDSALQHAMYGPIDLNDQDSWHRLLHKISWNGTKEYFYQKKVAAAISDGASIPPRFDPEAIANKNAAQAKAIKERLRAKAATQRSAAEQLSTTNSEDGGASHNDFDHDEGNNTPPEVDTEEQASAAISDETRDSPPIQFHEQQETRDWAAEKLLQLYALNEIFSYQSAVQEQDDVGEEDDTEGDEVDRVDERDDDPQEDADADPRDEADDTAEDSVEAAPAPQTVRSKPVNKGGYPIHAFGQYAPAVEQIARVVQVAPAMAGTGLIGMLSPLVQPLINVSHKALDDGMPVTINILCIAESGERKSSLLSVLTKPILRGIQEAGNGRSGMMTNDITVDGLIKGLINRCPAQYILAPEAVTLLGSHALSEEARGRFFGTASALYSGEALSRTRADEHVYSENRRLSLTLFGQPVVVRSFLGSELVMQQGTANRFLIAKPPSLRGQRLYCDEELDNHPEYLMLTKRLYELARQPWHIDEESKGIVPRVVRLSPDAKALWVAFYNRLEREIGDGGRYDDYPGYVGRYAEQTLRLAAILALLHDTNATHIDVDTMQCALDLGEYYLWQAMRVFYEMAAPN